MKRPVFFRCASALALGTVFFPAALQAGPPSGRLISWGPTLIPYIDPAARFIDVACGNGHTVALKSDGTVAAWGANEWGQSQPPVDLSDVVSVAAGGTFSAALREDGTVAAWGGQTASLRAVPAGLEGVVAIAAGEQHTLALKADGTIAGWGSTADGRRNFPEDLTNVVAIAAGGRHSLAVLADGSVRAFGHNGGGQISVPEDLAGVVAVAAGATHSAALSSDGTVRTWGSGGALIATNAAGLAAGGNATFAWDADGAMLATFGSGIPAGLNPVRKAARAPANGHSYAVQIDGALIGWGSSGEGQLRPELEDAEIVAAASNGNEMSDYTLALTAGGKVLAWSKDNRYGQTNVPPGLVDAVAIAAAPQGAMALRRDGTVVTWGSQNYPLPPDLTNVVAIAAGNFHRLALKDDGTVVQWPPGTQFVPQPPADLSGVISIACGTQHCLAVRKDGSVVQWGSPSTPAVPAELADVVAVATAASLNVALKSDGTVAAWGSATFPFQPPEGLENVVGIAVSANLAAALRDDGTVVKWGPGPTVRGTGQFLPSQFRDCIAVAAGRLDLFAIRTPLRFTRVEFEGHPSLGFHTFAGQNYTVEFSTDLAGGVWTPFEPIPGNGRPLTFADTEAAPEGERFYRIRRDPAPADAPNEDEHPEAD